MLTPDQSCAHYTELLDGVYDCVDRIILNGSYSLGEILKMIPGSELENKLLLNNLMARGVVRHGDS